MAFDKYKDGAWIEPEDTVRRYDKNLGAWVECENAQRYKDSAWQEVWSAMDVMTVQSCTLTNGDINISDNKREVSFFKFEDASQQTGSLSGSGYIEFVLEGEWRNPTVSFYYSGGMNHWNNTLTTCYGQTAGAVYLISIDSTGKQTTHDNITVGKSRSGGNSWQIYDGTLTRNLSGTFKKIILRIFVQDKSGTYYSGTSEIHVSNVTINGEPIGFTPDAEKYSKYINDY